MQDVAMIAQGGEVPMIRIGAKGETTMKFSTLSISVFALLGAFAGTAHAQPNYVPPTISNTQVDRTQPRMQAALRALQEAKASLEAASANKGRHRGLAIDLVDHAIAEVKEGILARDEDASAMVTPPHR